jgi:ribosomal protein S18 acetylase RimI-like enzyme
MACYRNRVYVSDRHVDGALVILMDIRPFTTSDQAAVITLWQDCGLTVPWNDPVKDIARKLSVNPEGFLVGEIGGRIIASVMVGYDGHRGWINYLAIASDHRRQGLGEKLMQRAESHLLEKRCPKINLQIRAGNTEVIEFYKAQGYSEDNTIGLGKRLVRDN